MPVPPEDRDPQPRTPENDVLAMLRLNKEREAQREINGPIEVPPKKSRRRRDYLLIIVGGNLSVVLLLKMLVGDLGLLFTRAGVVPLVYGGSAMIILTVGTTWVMYQVMDDY